MMTSITKAQAHFQQNRAFQNTGTLSKLNNRQNLSKSIVLHHNKLNSLLSTVGRYNEIIARQDIDDVDENEEFDEGNEDSRRNFGDEEDDGFVNNDIAGDNRKQTQKPVNASAGVGFASEAPHYTKHAL